MTKNNEKMLSTRVSDVFVHPINNVILDEWRLDRDNFSVKLHKQCSYIFSEIVF